MAQLGSAPALGAGGPRFESGRPDYFNDNDLRDRTPTRWVCDLTNRVHIGSISGVHRGGFLRQAQVIQSAATSPRPPLRGTQPHPAIHCSARPELRV